MGQEDASDAERRERLIRCRTVDQWTTCRRYADPAEREAARRAFRAKWKAFMERGWEELAASDPSGVSAVTRRIQEILPTHPDSIRVAELVARLVDLEAVADEPLLFAALLHMERHGHVGLAAGWAYRPAPRVPRRGTAFEDMFLLLGYGAAREPEDGCG